MSNVAKTYIPENLQKIIKSYLDLNQFEKIAVLRTTNSVNVNSISDGKLLDLFVNLEPVNNIRKINSFHKTVKQNLANNCIYICCAETISQRAKKFRERIPHGFKNLFLMLDFIFKRVLPKLPLTKYLYFSITKGHNRALSKAEILGRLSSCRFRILNSFSYKNKLYVISKKNEESKAISKPSYGLFISLDRVGLNKKIIKIYKIRTMHPFSEFIQEDIYNQNKLNEKGKIENDFRLTFWGKFLRRYWIDEFPQLYNFLKGDISLIGPRALSQHYFSIYPKNIQDLRSKIKPGLIPPFYADMPQSFDEIISSERKYILSKMNKPLKTDFIYFFKSVFNILVKGARSS